MPSEAPVLADDTLGPSALAIERARALERPVLLSRSVAHSPPEDLLALLHQMRTRDEPCFFWERPADRFSIAGIGVAWAGSSSGADRFTTIAQACAALAGEAIVDPPRVAEPLFVGGFAFAPEGDANGMWRGFPAGRLVLPRVVAVRRGSMTKLTLNAMVDPHRNVEAIQHDLVRDLLSLQRTVWMTRDWLSSVAPTRYDTTTTPTPADWKHAVIDTIADIHAGRLEKLVLARSCTITSDSDFDCPRIVHRLRERYPSCATFWVGTADGNFLGATPEPLVHLSNGVVKTAAIAGSIGRGTSPMSDRQLARVLAASVKDRSEQAIVVRAIVAALTPLCERVDVETEPQVLQLENVQHLMTTMKGRLKQSSGILDLVSRLHPSPAVGGHPRQIALTLMQRREPVNRGWYAGPVGWVNMQGGGEFGVAIRSALVRERTAVLYAGAGIVAGSDPDTELAETRLKLQPLLSALMEL